MKGPRADGWQHRRHGRGRRGGGRHAYLLTALSGFRAHWRTLGSRLPPRGSQALPDTPAQLIFRAQSQRLPAACGWAPGTRLGLAAYPIPIAGALSFKKSPSWLAGMWRKPQGCGEAWEVELLGGREEEPGGENKPREGPFIIAGQAAQCCVEQSG